MLYLKTLALSFFFYYKKRDKININQYIYYYTKFTINDNMTNIILAKLLAINMQI